MKLAAMYISLMFLAKAQSPAELKPQDSSKRDSTVEVTRPTGASPISVRLFETDVKYPDGKIRKATICIFYDRISGLFLWNYSEWPVGRPYLVLPDSDHFIDRGILYVSDTEIAHFTSNRLNYSSEKAASIEDATRRSIATATSIVQEGPRAMEARRRSLGFRQHLPASFFREKYQAREAKITLLSVDWKNPQWVLTIQGVWKEVVTLNDKFQIIGHAPAPGEIPKLYELKPFVIPVK